MISYVLYRAEQMQLQLYKNKITLKNLILWLHVWQVAGYLTDSNVLHNIVLQVKQLNIYFSEKLVLNRFLPCRPYHDQRHQCHLL